MQICIGLVALRALGRYALGVSELLSGKVSAILRRAGYEMAVEELWTTTEVARFLRVSPETVRNWSATGELPATRLPGKQGAYRFDPQVVRAFVAPQPQAA